MQTVLSTLEAAGRLPGVIGLRPYESFEVLCPDGGALVVTAVPARHGPVGCARLTGTVTGFVLAGLGLPTVYFSGDNAAVDLVEEVLSRLGAVDVAVMHVGAARTPLIDAPLALTNARPSRWPGCTARLASYWSTPMAGRTSPRGRPTLRSPLPPWASATDVPS